MLTAYKTTWKREALNSKNHNQMEIFLPGQKIKAILFEGIPEDVIIKMVYRDFTLIDFMTITQANKILNFPLPILDWNFEDKIYLIMYSPVDLPAGEFTILQMIDSSWHYK